MNIIYAMSLDLRFYGMYIVKYHQYAKFNKLEVASTSAFLFYQLKYISCSFVVLVAGVFQVETPYRIEASRPKVLNRKPRANTRKCTQLKIHF